MVVRPNQWRKNRRENGPPGFGHGPDRAELRRDFRLTEANEMAEREAALDMLTMIPGSRCLSVGVDLQQPHDCC